MSPLLQVDAINDSNQSPLLLACESSDSQWVNRDCDYEGLVSLLLHHHADVNRVDSFGETPLHMAVRLKNTRMAELLCKSGCCVNRASGENFHLGIQWTLRHHWDVTWPAFIGKEMWSTTPVSWPVHKLLCHVFTMFRASEWWCVSYTHKLRPPRR
jgi:hypothetical protein